MAFSWAAGNFADDNGQALSVVGTIYDAINERMAAVGETQMPPLVAADPSDDVPALSTCSIVHSCSETKPDVGTEHLRWRFFQKWCEDNCGKFVQRWEEEVELPIDDVTEINFWTLEALNEQAILGEPDVSGELGWTAVNAAGVTEYRKAEAGDRYGPWLMRELWSVLNLLTMTAKEAVWVDRASRTAENTPRDSYTGAYEQMTYDSIVGGAVDGGRWVVNKTVGTTLPPRATWQLNFRKSSGTWQYQGNAARNKAYAKVDGLYATINKTVRFVVNTRKPYIGGTEGTDYSYKLETFGNHLADPLTGQPEDDVLENKWSQWTSSVVLDEDETEYTTTVALSEDNGDTDWPYPPTDPGSTTPDSGGYQTGFARPSDINANTTYFNRSTHGWVLTDNATGPAHQLTDAGSLPTVSTTPTASVALIDWTGFVYRT